MELIEKIEEFHKVYKKLYRFRMLLLKYDKITDIPNYEDELHLYKQHKKSYLDLLRVLSAHPKTKRKLGWLKSPLRSVIPTKHSKLNIPSVVYSRDYMYSGTRNVVESSKRFWRYCRAKDFKFKTFCTLTVPSFDVCLSKEVRRFFNRLKYHFPNKVKHWRKIGPEKTYNEILVQMDTKWKRYNMDTPYASFFTYDVFLQKVWTWILNVQFEEREKSLVFNLGYLGTVEVQNKPHLHFMFTEEVPFSILGYYWEFPVLNTEKIGDPKKARSYISKYMMEEDDELLQSVSYYLIKDVSNRRYFVSRNIPKKENQWKYDSEMDVEMMGLSLKEKRELSVDLKFLTLDAVKAVFAYKKFIKEIEKSDDAEFVQESLEEIFHNPVFDGCLKHDVHKMKYEDFLDEYQVRWLFSIAANGLDRYWENPSYDMGLSTWKKAINKDRMSRFFEIPELKKKERFSLSTETRDEIKKVMANRKFDIQYSDLGDFRRFFKVDFSI